MCKYEAGGRKRKAGREKWTGTVGRKDGQRKKEKNQRKEESASEDEYLESCNGRDSKRIELRKQQQWETRCFRFFSHLPSQCTQATPGRRRCQRLGRHAWQSRPFAAVVSGMTATLQHHTPPRHTIRSPLDPIPRPHQKILLPPPHPQEGSHRAGPRIKTTSRRSHLRMCTPSVLLGTPLSFHCMASCSGPP